MSHDAISSWVENAKQSEASESASEGIRVIRRAKPDRGKRIMEIAEKLRPWLTKMFEGVRDREGKLVQPAHVRGIALNVAQSIVQEEIGNA